MRQFPASQAGSKLPGPGTGAERAALEHRRYSEWARPETSPEYSAAVEHEGQRHFFPLGTNDRKKALAEAAVITKLFKKRGWAALAKSVPREFTVAVFWLSNPVACTYATLFTVPDGAKAMPSAVAAASRSSLRIGLVEPEPQVARAVSHWIGLQPGCECEFVLSEWPDQALPESDLVLANRSLAEIAGDERLASVRARYPRTAVFPMGIYSESDSIFHSVSGVGRGYCFRRRVPSELFDPLGLSGGTGLFDPAAVQGNIQAYFQSLFDPAPKAESSVEWLNLTPRENEIIQCLSKGLKDKEIASVLNLSVWTVHGHVKNVFEKLRVHSRTEAVVKYLQK